MRFRILTSSCSWLQLLLLAGACSVLALASCAPRPQAFIAPQSPEVPFGLSLRGFGVDGLPGLHSFAFAGGPERLVLLAGRTNGLHGFAPSREAATHPAFPKEFANQTVYLVDLTTGRLLGSAAIGDLPSPYREQFQASNTQHLEVEGWLYVVGGYGPDPTTGTLVTLPYVTAVDIKALTQTVESGGKLDATFAAANMAHVRHPAMAVTGGDLEALDDSYLIVYGHRFDGEYTPGGGQAQQEYTNSVRVLTLSAERRDGTVTLNLNYKGSVPSVTTSMNPDNPYHRRDLTVKQAIDVAGNERVGVYGGVFKGGRMEGYMTPIYIASAPGGSGNCLQGHGLTICEDTSAVQLLSQYDCPVIQSYSSSRASFFSTFLGGISYYYWDPSCQCLKHDPVDIFGKGVDGLPFINSVSTLKVTSEGTSQHLHVDASFPPSSAGPKCTTADGTSISATFLGAETRFVTADGIPVTANGVIELDKIKERGVLGYLVGGIAASCPDNVPNCYASTKGTTCASSLIYEVSLDPTTPTSTTKLERPVGD